MKPTAKHQAEYDALHKRLLKLLELHEDGVYIGQEPYKSDYFRIFQDAYTSGYCTRSSRFDVEKGRYVPTKYQKPMICGDSIWDFAVGQGWAHSEMSGDEKRYRDIELLRQWWDAWTYAYNHNPPAHRYTRRAVRENEEVVA